MHNGGQIIVGEPLHVVGAIEALCMHRQYTLFTGPYPPFQIIAGSCMQVQGFYYIYCLCMHREGSAVNACMQVQGPYYSMAPTASKGPVPYNSIWEVDYYSCVGMEL